MNTIFVLKVRENPIDGWGQSVGIRTTELGYYNTKEAAERALSKRKLASGATYCDVGDMWIDKETVIE